MIDGKQEIFSKCVQLVVLLNINSMTLQWIQITTNNNFSDTE